MVNISEKFFEKETKIRSIVSGFITNKRGHVVTADHLLGNATEIKVTLLDNRRFVAKTIGRDSSANVAPSQN